MNHRFTGFVWILLQYKCFVIGTMTGINYPEPVLTLPPIGVLPFNQVK